MADDLKTANLVGTAPKDVLSYGPSKLMVEKYLWHSPDVGIVSSYTPTDKDVLDHFGIFRGVDQVEAFAQATIVSCIAYLEKRKLGCSHDEIKRLFLPVFISIGQVNFHSYLQAADTFVSLGQIKSYKFRQMICEGRIYKAPKTLNLDDYFSGFNEKRLLNYDLSNDFLLVAELQGITGRGIKNLTKQAAQ